MPAVFIGQPWWYDSFICDVYIKASAKVLQHPCTFTGRGSCIYAYINIHIYMHMYYGNMYVQITARCCSIPEQARVYISIYMYVHLYIYIYMYTCIREYVYIYTYIYI